MRFVRLLWILLFILPLGLLADRLCYLNIVDPTYHALVWMHERMGYVLLGLAMVSAAAAFARFLRIQGQLRSLETLRSETPSHIVYAFNEAATQFGVRASDVLYVDVPMVFCFAVFGGRIVISRGFASLLEASDLRLVVAHELLHLRARDPLKALLWHLFFAALIVPGLEPLEDALYQRRERCVDRSARALDAIAYDRLLAQFSSTMCTGTPSSAFRVVESAPSAIRGLLPTALPLGALALLVASHVSFVQNLSYLQAHHC